MTRRPPAVVLWRRLAEERLLADILARVWDECRPRRGCTPCMTCLHSAVLDLEGPPLSLQAQYRVMVAAMSALDLL